jgi:CTP synthase
LVSVPNFINVNILERVNMTYLIKPYESIGDFVFGTSLEEIQEKYGKPARMVEDNIMNNKVEYRNACELV